MAGIWQPGWPRTPTVFVWRQAASAGRRGDTYLRTLLIHGARAVLRYVKAKTDPLSIRLQQLIARRGYNCAAVALASKNSRIIQALLSHEQHYFPHDADP
jgi:transposase